MTTMRAVRFHTPMKVGTNLDSYWDTNHIKHKELTMEFDGMVLHANFRGEESQIPVTNIAQMWPAPQESKKTKKA